METKGRFIRTLIDGVPCKQYFNKAGYFIGWELDKDTMEKQAYRYRVKNLKLQTIRIALSSIKILLVIAIFIYWITRR